MAAFDCEPACPVFHLHCCNHCVQEHEEALRTFPCTYRTLTSCICWMVRGGAGVAGLLAPLAVAGG